MRMKLKLLDIILCDGQFFGGTAGRLEALVCRAGKTGCRLNLAVNELARFLPNLADEAAGAAGIRFSLPL